MTEFHYDAHSQEVLPGRPVLVGVPLDLSVVKRSGCAKGPKAIREISWFVEPYSPALNIDLKECTFADIGDMDLAGRSLERALGHIRQTMSALLRQGCRPLSVGGEHTVTLPIIQAFWEVYPDLRVVHVDAHADLRDELEGSRLNHATVMRRISEIIGPERLIQVGVRSGTREEFEWMRGKQTLLHGEEAGGGVSRAFFSTESRITKYTSLWILTCWTLLVCLAQGVQCLEVCLIMNWSFFCTHLRGQARGIWLEQMWWSLIRSWTDLGRHRLQPGIL